MTLDVEAPSHLYEPRLLASGRLHLEASGIPETLVAAHRGKVVHKRTTGITPCRSSAS
jgi:hypothetical protein